MKLGDSLQDLTDSPSKPSYRAALGDVAASFDFGPPLELKRKNRFHSTLTSPDVVWPAYIVFGNGDVIIAYTDLSPDPARLVVFGGLVDNAFVIVWAVFDWVNWNAIHNEVIVKLVQSIPYDVNASIFYNLVKSCIVPNISLSLIYLINVKTRSCLVCKLAEILRTNCSELQRIVFLNPPT